MSGVQRCRHADTATTRRCLSYEFTNRYTGNRSPLGIFIHATCERRGHVWGG